MRAWILDGRGGCRASSNVFESTSAVLLAKYNEWLSYMIVCWSCSQPERSSRRSGRNSFSRLPKTGRPQL